MRNPEIRTRVEQALSAFNALRSERDSYRPTNDFDDTVFAYDQGLADLGERLADAVAELLGDEANSDDIR